MVRPKAMSVVLISILVFLATGCGSNTPTPAPSVSQSPQVPSLVSISVSVPNPSLPDGASEMITASGTYSDGSTHDLSTTANWSSSSSALASVGSSNGAESVSAAPSGTGVVTLTAQDQASGITGSIEIGVTDATLTSLSVSGPASINMGQTGQFVATGTYSDGTQLDLTSLVSWSSSAPTVLTISGSPGSYGVAQIVGLGSATVSAVEPISGLQASAESQVVCDDSATDGIQAGDGSPGNPYKICSYSGLQGINNHMSSDYILMADIDLSSVSNFTPIGASDSTFYSGTLNGNFHKISNLTVSSNASCGLFVGLQEGTIENLGLENVNINATSPGLDVGALAAESLGETISGVYATGSIQGQYDGVGGLVGLFASYLDFPALLLNSYAQLTLSGDDTAGLVYAIGGAATIENSYAVTPGGADGLVRTPLAAPGTVVTSSYYDTADSSSSLLGTGLTDAQMQEQSSFSGWDFTNVWEIPSGGGYPVLRGF